MYYFNFKRCVKTTRFYGELGKVIPISHKTLTFRSLVIGFLRRLSSLTHYANE